MSAYIIQYCAVHGDWDMDVDNLRDCPECENGKMLPLQVVTRQRDELLEAIKNLVDGLENDPRLSRLSWELTVDARAAIAKMEQVK